MIRSPYNFVPVSDKVFFPDWADQISHDIPFSDGISGKITLEIEAQTPIFVRNGHAGNAVDNSFSRTNDNRYFIPGTSIKGAIRNVLEIISHGKMRTYKNRLLAQREWYNTTLYDLKGKQQNFKCGWLRWDKDNGYHIVDCGKPYRIGHDRIDEYIESQCGNKRVFTDKFKQGGSFNLNKEVTLNRKKYDPKTAVYKYALVDNSNICLDNLAFITDERHNASMGFHRVKVHLGSAQEFNGTIVFTGQPNKWIDPRPKTLTTNAGKFYDFVFVNPTSDATKHSITNDEFESYQSIYKDSPDWIYWYDKIDSMGIPVFYMKEKGKSLKWGLALLFKLPYDHTPFDTLPNSHKTDEYDLADCIFGSVDKDKSLKGRVIFGHAFCKTEEVRPMPDVRLILSSPKASYYPTYIEQDGANGVTTQYKTYNDGRISGWKRYYAKETVTDPTLPPLVVDGQNVSDRVYTTLSPLPQRTQFSSTVFFHNLKPEELGSLLSALTFHGHSNCFHQLGQGKPFGYGRVSICPKLKLYDSQQQGISIDFYMDKFDKLLRNHSLSVNVLQLATMASDLKTGSQYEYMNLSMRGNNEFQQAKDDKRYLEPVAVSLAIKSEYDAKLKLAAEEKEKQRELEEQLRHEQKMARLAMDQLISDANTMLVNNNYAAALSKYQEIYDITKDEAILSKIETCRMKLENQIVPLSEYLKELKVSSIPAFTTGLEKKWMIPNGKTALDNAEISQLVKFLSGIYSALSAKDKKKWSNVKDWKKLHELIGKDIYVEIIK